MAAALLGDEESGHLTLHPCGHDDAGARPPANAKKERARPEG